MNTLEYYKKDSESRESLHLKCKRYYSFVNNVLNSISIFLVASTGLANNITTILSESSVAVGIVYSVLLYLSVMIRTYQTYFDVAKLAENHRTSAQTYSVFRETIMEYIDKDKDVDDILWKNYHLLNATSPDIPDHIKDSSTIDQETDKDDPHLDYELNRWAAGL